MDRIAKLEAQVAKLGADVNATGHGDTPLRVKYIIAERVDVVDSAGLVRATLSTERKGGAGRLDLLNEADRPVASVAQSGIILYDRSDGASVDDWAQLTSGALAIRHSQGMAAIDVDKHGCPRELPKVVIAACPALGPRRRWAAPNVARRRVQPLTGRGAVTSGPIVPEARGEPVG
jgi:hypothetical protein